MDGDRILKKLHELNFVWVHFLVEKVHWQWTIRVVLGEKPIR
jgi:hypothetical protein